MHSWNRVLKSLLRPLTAILSLVECILQVSDRVHGRPPRSPDTDTPQITSKLCAEMSYAGVLVDGGFAPAIFASDALLLLLVADVTAATLSIDLADFNATGTEGDATQSA